MEPAPTRRPGNVMTITRVSGAPRSALYPWRLGAFTTSRQDVAHVAFAE
jgi:hypothetical protein